MRHSFPPKAVLFLLLAGTGCGGSPSAPAEQDRPPRPEPAREAPRTFPPAFIGTWGLVEADCDATRSDTKGRMEITAEQVQFYESRATITEAETQGERALEVELAFTGEGQTWSTRTRLELGDDDTLSREDAEGPLKGALTYRRCP